jgi:hypothetical protein
MTEPWWLVVDWIGHSDGYPASVYLHRQDRLPKWLKDFKKIPDAHAFAEQFITGRGYDFTSETTGSKRALHPVPTPITGG